MGGSRCSVQFVLGVVVVGVMLVALDMVGSSRCSVLCCGWWEFWWWWYVWVELDVVGGSRCSVWLVWWWW